MNNIYQIYLDSFFLINAVYFYCMQNIGACILKCTVTRFKIIKSSLAGTTLYCVLILTPGISIYLKIAIGYIFLPTVMLVYTYHIRSLKELLRTSIASYGTLIIVGGSMTLLTRLLGITRWSTITIFITVLVLSEIIPIAVKIIRGKMKTEFCSVQITLNNVEVSVVAFIDNGNGLLEPFTKKPVSIIEKGFFNDKILLPEKYKAIPFHALGTDKGILDGYEADMIKIRRGTENYTIYKPIIAICEESISGNRKYQMILHPDLLREREEFI